jgi:hypothetical protein
MAEEGHITSGPTSGPLRNWITVEVRKWLGTHEFATTRAPGAPRQWCSQCARSPTRECAGDQVCDRPDKLL